MTESEKKKLIKQNTILWIAAMIVTPLFWFCFQFASKPVKFPWPIIVPLMMVGLLNGSNAIVKKAIGDLPENDSQPDEGNE